MHLLPRLSAESSPWQLFLDGFHPYFMYEKIILLPELKGSHRSVVESTHYQDLGEASAGCQKELEAEEGGGRAQGQPRKPDIRGCFMATLSFGFKVGGRHTLVKGG